MGKIIRRLGYLLVILTVCVMVTVPVVAPLSVLANGDPVSINLRVTGSGPTDIINEPGYSVPSGNITKDGVTVDKQTAMGALICCCQDKGINIEVTEYGGDAYVVQIGDNATDYNNWVYAYNERVNWVVGAADQAVTDNDSVHWFNYTLEYYQLLLEIDHTKIVQGENITATVTWTNGSGTAEPTDNASVYVSNSFGMFQPDPGEFIGNTDASGSLTFSWNETGQFWPYAEASDNRTSISQYPAPTFVAASSNISLYTGWNLLSTPILLDTDSDNMGQIFGGSLASILILYRWDAVGDEWDQVFADYELLPLEAVYVKVEASATAEFVPSQELFWPPSRELEPGLNLIGPAPAFENGDFPAMPLDQALVSIAEAEGGLRGYTMVVSPPHNQPGWAYALGGEIEDLLPFKGYWVVMENADTLYGFSTTPLP